MELIAKIRELNEVWMKDFSNADAIAVGSHYTDDAISLAPGRNPIVGKEEIIKYWQEAMESGVGALNIKSEEVQQSGNIATEIGQTDLVGANGEIIDKFNYMVVWKEENGKWLIYREIWNSIIKLEI